MQMNFPTRRHRGPESYGKRQPYALMFFSVILRVPATRYQ